MYGICGAGITEFKDFESVLSHASTDLLRLTLKKNIPYDLRKSKVIDRTLSYDIDSRYILQLFYNIIYGYIKTSNFQNEFNDTKIKRMLLKYFNFEKCNVEGILEKIKPYVDSLTPQFPDYREYYRNDYANDITDECIKEYPILDDNSIHTTCFTVETLLGYSPDAKLNQDLNDTNFVSVDENLYRNRLSGFLHNTRTKKCIAPKLDDVIAHTVNTKLKSVTTRIKYPEPEFKGQLVKVANINVVVSQDTQNNHSVKKVKIVDHDKLHVNTTGLFMSDIDYNNQLYNVRVTSSELHDVASHHIRVLRDVKTNQITLVTRGIQLGEILKQDIFNHFTNTPNEIFDESGNITFDEVVQTHRYTN